METNMPSTFVESNDEGLQMVQRGNYAFFCETTQIEYFTQGHCDVTQIGEKLDSKEYGIAMPMSE